MKKILTITLALASMLLVGLRPTTVVASEPIFEAFDASMVWEKTPLPLMERFGRRDYSAETLFFSIDIAVESLGKDFPLDGSLGLSYGTEVAESGADLLASLTRAWLQKQWYPADLAPFTRQLKVSPSAEASIPHKCKGGQVLCAYTRHDSQATTASRVVLKASSPDLGYTFFDVFIENVPEIGSPETLYGVASTYFILPSIEKMYVTTWYPERETSAEGLKWQSENVFKEDLTLEEASLQISEFPRTHEIMFNREAFPDDLSKGINTGVAVRGGTFTIMDNGRERSVTGIAFSLHHSSMRKSPPPTSVPAP